MFEPSLSVTRTNFGSPAPSRFYRKRGFLVPLLGSILQKIRKNGKYIEEVGNTRNFPFLLTMKSSKKSEIAWNVEKIENLKKNIFSVMTKKNKKIVFKFFFKVVQNHLERWENLKSQKKISYNQIKIFKNFLKVVQNHLKLASSVNTFSGK